MFIAFDLMVAAEARNLALANRERTTVIASTSRTPTGEMVYDARISYPEQGSLLAQLSGAASRMETLDALAAAEALFGSTDVANLLVIGAAFQAGALPISASSLERAIQQNGVAVALNTAAFRWGRLSVADPATFSAATNATPMRTAVSSGEDLLLSTPLTGETLRLTSVRAAALCEHSGRGAAHNYVRLVERAWVAERRVGERTEFSEAVSRGGHRLAAYKDEYEVARLLTDRGLEREVLAQVPGATSASYNLHPPALRTLGLRNKIKMGPRTKPLLRLLAQGRRLRGTPFDLFGWAKIRRIERALVRDYAALVDTLTDETLAERYDVAVAAAGAADVVRGYEGVKLGNIQIYRELREQLGVPISAELVALMDQ